MKKKIHSETEPRRREIEQTAIAELQLTGESHFILNEADAGIMFHRVVELLFHEQRHQHKLLYLADISVLTPDIKIRQRKIFISCEVVISNPVQMNIVFSYSLKNSKNTGELDIDSIDRIKVTLKGNRIKKELARKLLNHFDLAGITEDILNNLNEVLRHILMADHGQHCDLGQVNLTMLSNGLLVKLKSA